MFCNWNKADKPSKHGQALQLVQPINTKTIAPNSMILLEVVSATNLSLGPTTANKDMSLSSLSASFSIASINSSRLDPYCVVKIGETEIHRTKAIVDDNNPIWTVKTQSLCILPIPEEEDDYVVVQEDDVYRDEDDEEKQAERSEKKEYGGSKDVIIYVCNSNQCIGVVKVPFEELRKGQGNRVEYSIGMRGDNTNKSSNSRGTLALRFRSATSDDISFFRSDVSPVQIEGKASDVNFKHIRYNNIMQTQRKKDANRNCIYRIQPGPDPNRKESTTWMTKKALREEALKPSTTWVQTGSGKLGTAFVEILGCNDLPNMDVGLNDKTDPFVALVMEDSMVRTDIIHDTLSPRWMPWSTRAFAFNVVHPSSLIMLGVFDFDGPILDDHDTIGRVVIDCAKFDSGTTYLLHYPLHDDPQEEDTRGEIIIRFRVEWRSEAEAMKMSLTTPPRFLINVDNSKAFKVLRYVCRGKVNMEKASLQTIKIQAYELMSYGSSICYVIDVLLGVLLWRGRTNINIPCSIYTLNIWFPIHSVALFAAAVFAIEFPTLIPVILFYGLAWIMATINYHGSIYPNPWKRCKSMQQENKVMILGDCEREPVFIKPGQGVAEGEALDKLDAVKAERVQVFLSDLMKVALKARRMYSKSNMQNISLETEDLSGSTMLEKMVGSYLAYLHLMLYYMCTYLRMLRNLITSKSSSSHRLTMYLVFAGTFWLVTPMEAIVLWSARAFVWTFLGPWMKIVDIWFVHPHYRTTEELKQDPVFRGTNLESLFDSSKFQEMAKSVRVAAEDARKLKDMREYRFGKWSEVIPTVDMSRFPSVPSDASTAEPYLGAPSPKTLPNKEEKTKRDIRKDDNKDEDEHRGYVDIPKKQMRIIELSGQKLAGNMLHKPIGNA